jgi:hypothetical protein
MFMCDFFLEAYITESEVLFYAKKWSMLHWFIGLKIACFEEGNFKYLLKISNFFFQIV